MGFHSQGVILVQQHLTHSSASRVIFWEINQAPNRFSYFWSIRITTCDRLMEKTRGLWIRFDLWRRKSALIQKKKCYICPRRRLQNFLCPIPCVGFISWVHLSLVSFLRLNVPLSCKCNGFLFGRTESFFASFYEQSVLKQKGTKTHDSTTKNKGNEKHSFARLVESHRGQAKEGLVRRSFPMKRFLAKKKETIFANLLIGSWDWHRQMIL